MSWAEKIKETIQARPWLPWVVGGGVIGLVVLARRRQAGTGAIVSVPVPTGATPGLRPSAPVEPSTTLREILSGFQEKNQQQFAELQTEQRTTAAGFLDAIGRIYQQTKESLTETQHQVSASVVPVQASVSTVKEAVADVQAQVSGLAAKVAEPVKQIFSFAGYDASTGRSAPTSVVIDNPYESGIAAAKVKYATATTDAERAAARAEADRYRAAAREAGATLDRELQSGDTVNPVQSAPSSYNPFGPTPV